MHEDGEVVGMAIFSKRSVLHLDGITEILDLMDKNGNMRFSEIMKGLRKEKNPPLKNAAVLSYRLRTLEKSGLIVKDTENRQGEQVKIFYYLTADGREALLHLKKLDDIIRKASFHLKE